MNKGEMAKGEIPKNKTGRKKFPGPGRPKRLKTEDETSLDKKTPIRTPKRGPTQAHEASSSTEHKELFRTDFINAMRLNDNDILERERCLLLVDSWRQEWNTGVQCPVNTEKHETVAVGSKHFYNSKIPFKMSKKLIRRKSDKKIVKKANNNNNKGKNSEPVCRYDLDELDTSWLEMLNEARRSAGAAPVDPLDMERIMDALESSVYSKIQEALLTCGFQNKGREFDSAAVCDVCFQGESYEDDEIIFCDRCDLAVHETCYGVQSVPAGPWVCRACSLQTVGEVKCMLCPNRNGAFKCTQSGNKWAHVSCVWWIPEVKFEDCDRMEPIINVHKIPADRWNLKCTLCHKKEGCCIQCSSLKCADAYHVTCAQRKGLFMEMKAAVSEETGDDYLEQQSFCYRHSAEMDRLNPPIPSSSSCSTPPHSSSSASLLRSPSRLLPESPMKKKQRRLQTLESSFFAYADPDEVSTDLNLPLELTETVMEYWKIKRKAKGCGPLITPKDEEGKILEKHEREVLTRRVRVLFALRQNLEKARNLCYMIQKRERLQRDQVKVMEETFEIIRKCGDDAGNNARSASLYMNFLKPTNDFEDLIIMNNGSEEDRSNYFSKQTAK